MTVYRRFPRRDDMNQALRLREIQRFLAAVAAGIDRAEDRRTSVSEAFVAAVTFAQRHPLLRRLAITDPGLALETVAANDNEILSMGAAFIAREIHGDAPGEPSQQVRWVADTLRGCSSPTWALRPLILPSATRRSCGASQTRC